MEKARRGESNPSPFRSKRLYSANGQWFFDTREGVQYGPYRSMVDAKVALAVFIAERLYELNVENAAEEGQVTGEDDLAPMVQEFLTYMHYRGRQGLISALAWANKRRGELERFKNRNSAVAGRLQTLAYAIDLDG